MTGIKAEIIRYVDDDQPGWIECQFIDVHGRRWVFVEKVPIVTAEYLNAFSDYPRSGLIDCQVIERSGNTVRVETTLPSGIESVDGQTEFEIAAELLVDDGRSMADAQY